jgi:ubiquinol-cytochrome c reductase cytochrome c subunit
VTALAARRRHPMATALVVLLGLVLAGLAYAAFMPGQADASTASTENVAAGHDLFLSNCSTCHGVHAEGRDNAPSLIGVGSAAVDFQVGTGRMPLANSNVQAPQAPVRLKPSEISDLAAYIASLAPGPSIPDSTAINPDLGTASRGALIFRTNCAMCHGAAGKGGALTRGKYAPNLTNVEPKYIYEAMVTGPQSMPVFNDQTILPTDKRDVIAYLTTLNKEPNPGGLGLGRIGPVSEGLVAWVVGLTLLVGFATWLGTKSS